MRKLIFVDRDGTIIQEPADQQIDSLEKLEFVEGAILGLRSLLDHGYQLVLVSNQDGLGSDTFPMEDFRKPQDKMLGILRSCGIEFVDILICPHRPDDRCLCRKPGLGLVKDFLAEGFDRYQSAVIGDRESDEQLAEGLGIRGFRLGSGLTWPRIVTTLTSTPRVAQVRRTTKETKINVEVDLDHFYPPRVETGSAFFDHMLEQIGIHAGVGLTIATLGDWNVDDHHSIEDTALALGECLRKALGDKHGIDRYGFTLPMDEALADGAIDLSGRPYCHYEAPFTRESVGGLATEMVPHFFRSLADGLRAAIHISIKGDNNHHLVEAGFKVFGRCLGQATKRSGEARIPSSKGAL